MYYMFEQVLSLSIYIYIYIIYTYYLYLYTFRFTGSINYILCIIYIRVYYLPKHLSKCISSICLIIFQCALQKLAMSLWSWSVRFESPAVVASLYCSCTAILTVIIVIVKVRAIHMLITSRTIDNNNDNCNINFRV